MAKLKQSLLQPDEGAAGTPRIGGFSEVGYTGLKITSKAIQQERDKRFRMPQRIVTVGEMTNDPIIGAALNIYKIMIGRVKWRVEAPVDATAKQTERAKFVESCMEDMDDQSWFAYIQSLLPYLEYGFAISEKVFKRRTLANSKYDDGFVGIAKLPIRDQSTISGWIFSGDGRTLDGFEQSLTNISYPERFKQMGGTVKVDNREKFMLFRSMPKNGNPEGTPLMRAAFVPWHYKQIIEEQQAIGASRDLAGILKMIVPADYMDPNASDDKKAAYEEMKRVLRNISTGEQQGLMLPSNAFDESKTKMFDAELMSSAGARAFDTQAIIQQLQSQMLISMFADTLQLGSNGQGSFALNDGKMSLLETAVEYRLSEIADVLNRELIPTLFKFNGWTDTEYPKFVWGSISDDSLDELGKFLQRVASNGLIEIDREMLNRVRVAAGARAKPDDEPVDKESLSGATSKAGAGMSKGSGNGTSDKPATGDNSVGNSQNAA